MRFTALLWYFHIKPTHLYYHPPLIFSAIHNNNTTNGIIEYPHGRCDNIDNNYQPKRFISYKNILPKKSTFVPSMNFKFDLSLRVRVRLPIYSPVFANGALSPRNHDGDRAKGRNCLRCRNSAKGRRRVTFTRRLWQVTRMRGSTVTVHWNFISRPIQLQ